MFAIPPPSSPHDEPLLRNAIVRNALRSIIPTISVNAGTLQFTRQSSRFKAVADQIRSETTFENSGFDFGPTVAHRTHPGKFRVRLIPARRSG